MIYKQLDFPGMDPETGQIFTEAYSPGDSLLKLAGAKNYDPALEKFLKGLKKSPSKIYVIVTALGSGEYYGANVNNDFYEEKELLNPNPQYGYTTFLTAGIFRFHLNKDKTKSFGIVVFATYNHRMHRVELVVEIDKALARTHGHESLVAALENGEHPSVSMGCRVKFDVCCICKHRSRTRADYCTCARNFLGKILPNGRKVYVTNPDMVFFDLSFVLVGADKVSFVMEKVAGYALAKVSYDKISTLVKEIPDLAHHLDPLFKREDTLPQSVMDSMGGLTLPQATGALLGKGIILKPVEFQYMVLQRKECPQEAQDLLRRNIVFAPMGAPAGLNMIQESFMDYPLGLPAQVLTRRCFSSPLLAARVPNLVRAQPPDIEIPMQSPLSGMLSSTYLDYRRNILDMLPSLMIRFPLEKTASPVNALWVTLLPILYLFSAHLRSKEREHIPLSGTERFIMQHPIMSAAAIAGLGLGVKELRNLLV